jgi:hypothetical protein
MDEFRQEYALQQLAHSRRQSPLVQLQLPLLLHRQQLLQLLLPLLLLRLPLHLQPQLPLQWLHQPLHQLHLPLFRHTRLTTMRLKVLELLKVCSISFFILLSYEYSKK